MSDVDEYVGSPEYDFDADWEEEGTFGLADDLAEHATHSPVWQENCAGELEPYYSDWEYYSDDYYDDDHGILKEKTLDGGAPRATSYDGRTQQKRGKKRKLDEDREGQMTAKETNSLKESIQGTVWAQKQENSVQIFKKGEQETVALLANWRDILREQDGTIIQHGWSRSNEDESWANDMSLEAMGLHQQVGQSEPQIPSDAEEDGPSDVDVDIKSSDSSHLSAELSEPETNHQSQRRLSTIKDEEDQPERYFKRRKIQDLPSPPTSTESTSLHLIDGQTSIHGRARKSLNARTGLAQSEQAMDLNQHDSDRLRRVPEKPAPETMTNGRKRRLSAAEQDVDPKPGKASKRPKSQTSPSSTSSKTQRITTNQTSSPPRRSQRLKKEAG